MKHRNYPWVVKGAAIALQRKLEHTPNATILEFGSGGSTIWFAERCSKIISVETNQEWFDYIVSKVDASVVDMVMAQEGDHEFLKEFCDAIPNESMDVVFVDGKDREVCARLAKSKVKYGGMFMLDNSEQLKYQHIHKMMNDWPKTTRCGAIDLMDIPGKPGWSTTWWIKS